MRNQVSLLKTLLVVLKIGGVMVNESFVCSTYWHPDPADPFKNGGVSNITEKIVGDDGAFIVQQ